MPEHGDYFKSAFSINCSIFGYSNNVLKILLVRRKVEPFEGRLSLPSRLIGPDEGIEESVGVMLAELLGNSFIYKKQLRSFVDPERHPFGRVITIPYFSLLSLKEIKVSGETSFSTQANWYDVDEIPGLPFDHSSIINTAREKLKEILPYEREMAYLLPNRFTMAELHNLTESILDQNLDKRNFSKKLIALDSLEHEEEYTSENTGRPAKLFSMNGISFQDMNGK